MTSVNAQPSNSRDLTQDLIPVLQKFDKNSQQSNIHVTKNQFTIGRSRENDEVICSVLISRNHCVLKCNDEGDWMIENLSSNGTILNGQLLSPNASKIIGPGDVVQLAMGFKYFFTMRFKEELPSKRRKLEEAPSNENRPNTFTDYQKLKREELEKELELKTEKQKELRLLLAENLQRQATENDDVITERIIHLRSAVASADEMVKILEGARQRYMSEIYDERKEFHQKLTIPRRKVQSELNVSDEQIERILGKKIDNWITDNRNKWSEIMRSMMIDKKLQHEKLTNDNLNLTAKLKKTQESLETAKQTLREKSLIAQQLEQQCIRGVIDVDKNGFRDKIEALFEEQLSCSICAEIFVDPTSLNCSHTFCKHCISSWRKKNRKANCPICRVKIKSMNQSRAFDCVIERIVNELSSELKQRRELLIKERTGCPNVPTCSVDPMAIGHPLQLLTPNILC